MDDRCVKCARPLTAVEIGATKKFINRGAEEFYCLDCLAERFKVCRNYIEEKIEYFSRNGCSLFPK